MSQPDAIIRIKNLRLRTFIGIKEEEIANRQDVVVNVAIHYPADKARDSEDINDALNYRTITKRIISHLENGRFAAGKINSGCAEYRMRTSLGHIC